VISVVRSTRPKGTREKKKKGEEETQTQASEVGLGCGWGGDLTSKRSGCGMSMKVEKREMKGTGRRTHRMGRSKQKIKECQETSP